jgi:hypothetical protein
MSAIERLVQKLGALLTLVGEQHPARVQIVLRSGRRFLSAEFDEDLPQLGRR